MITNDPPKYTSYIPRRRCHFFPLPYAQLIPHVFISTLWNGPIFSYSILIRPLCLRSSVRRGSMFRVVQTLVPQTISYSSLYPIHHHRQWPIFHHHSSESTSVWWWSLMMCVIRGGNHTRFRRADDDPPPIEWNRNLQSHRQPIQSGWNKWLDWSSSSYNQQSSRESL